MLAASTGDALAANALLHRAGLQSVRARIEQLGLRRTALLDRFRDDRGPDDAPHVALSTAREMAQVFAGLVNSSVVSPGVSAQVAEWLSLNHDLSLVASATGLDPFSHENDQHGLLFVNKTGRAAGVRAEAGVLADPAREWRTRSSPTSTTCRSRIGCGRTTPSACSASSSWVRVLSGDAPRLRNRAPTRAGTQSLVCGAAHWDLVATRRKGRTEAMSDSPATTDPFANSSGPEGHSITDWTDLAARCGRTSPVAAPPSTTRSST